MLNIIHTFECNANSEDFDQIFGLGNHIWRKFVKFNHSVIKLHSYLDLDHQAKLQRYFNERQLAYELEQERLETIEWQHSRLVANAKLMRGPVEEGIE